MISLLLALAVSTPTFANEVEELTYQLTANGKSVGERTVTLRYFQDEGREVRIVESFTDLDLDLGNLKFSFTQRMGGQGGEPAGTFTSSVSQSDGLKEVQAVRRSDGWQVTIVQPNRLAEESYLPSQLDATSLTLIDPGAKGYLSGKSQLRVLTAETGMVLSGGLRAAGETSLNLGGETVAGEVWLWSPEAGDVEMVYGELGHLLRYTMSVAGITVKAELTDAPEARTYGETLEVGGLIDAGNIRAESL